MPTTIRALVLLLPLLTVVACASPGDGGTPPEDRPVPSATPPAPSAAAMPPLDPPSPAPPAVTAAPTRPPLSATEPPTMPPPAVKPSPPSDLRQTDLVSGTVTRGGTGPCYGLVSEDGIEYALHGPDAGELRTGSFVTLRLGPARARIACGPGLARTIVSR
ncbi:hypothetical protein ACFY2Q_01350 [Micromonospora sp. NPDC000316]|uniref:hypothetical protein n=1 Tax=Micromonospora sp. NPDC000316 TaxID=3364216 RepID=UPI0036CC45A5